MPPVFPGAPVPAESLGAPLTQVPFRAQELIIPMSGTEGAWPQR